jgi:hypothetical protein
MPEPEQTATGAGPVLWVPGLYEALLVREQDAHARHSGDPREILYGTLAGDPVVFRRPTALLRALESGEPVTVPAWRLGGWGLPKVPLSRAQRQWGRWYRVAPDDSVQPASAPR